MDGEVAAGASDCCGVHNCHHDSSLDSARCSAVCFVGFDVSIGCQMLITMCNRQVDSDVVRIILDSSTVVDTSHNILVSEFSACVDSSWVPTDRSGAEDWINADVTSQSSFFNWWASSWSFNFAPGDAVLDDCHLRFYCNNNVDIGSSFPREDARQAVISYDMLLLVTDMVEEDFDSVIVSASARRLDALLIDVNNAVVMRVGANSDSCPDTVVEYPSISGVMDDSCTWYKVYPMVSTLDSTGVMTMNAFSASCQMESVLIVPVDITTNQLIVQPGVVVEEMVAYVCISPSSHHRWLWIVFFIPGLAASCWLLTEVVEQLPAIRLIWLTYGSVVLFVLSILHGASMCWLPSTVAIFDAQCHHDVVDSSQDFISSSSWNLVLPLAMCWLPSTVAIFDARCHHDVVDSSQDFNSSSSWNVVPPLELSASLYPCGGIGFGNILLSSPLWMVGCLITLLDVAFSEVVRLLCSGF